MESITKVTELTLDNIDYVIRLRIDFIPGKKALDPTEQTDTEITGHEILNVDAWNHDLDFGYTVSDPDELDRIENEIDVENEFWKP
jgi:hypothetical protein